MSSDEMAASTSTGKVDGVVVAEAVVSAADDKREILAASSSAAALHRLVVDLGDAAIVEQFVADYLRLLDRRITSLEQLLSGPDIEATAVSLLTLETSSAMMGGHDVVAAARALRRAVEQRETGSIADLFDRLRSRLVALEEQLPAVELRPRPAPHPAVGEPVGIRRRGLSR